MTEKSKRLGINQLPEVIKGRESSFSRVRGDQIVEEVVVDPMRLPSLMPSAVIKPLPKAGVGIGSDINFVVNVGGERYGISLEGDEVATQPLGQAHEFPQRFLDRFYGGRLTQAESRRMDAVSFLDYAITSAHPEQIGEALSVEERNHTRLLSRDILGEVVSMHPDREDEILKAYETFAYPFIKRVFEEVADQEGSRNTMPRGCFKGIQGRANGRMLTRYLIEERKSLDLEYLNRHLCSGEFDAAFFQDEGFGSMLTSVYGNSPSEALIDYTRHHRDDRYKRVFAGLRSYHFPSVNKQWTVRGDGSEEMVPRWEFNNEKKVWKNRVNARKAVGELVDVLIGNPHGKPMEIGEYIRRVEGVVRTITNDIMDWTDVRHGGHFGGLRMEAYDGHNAEAVMDFLGYHWDGRVREHFKDLKEYHFTQGAHWTLPDGSKNYRLAQEAIGELTEVLSDGGMRIDEIPKKISQEVACGTKIKYGSTLTGMFQVVYGSHVLGYIDFLKNHPNDTVKKIFSDIDVYHFKNPPKRTWTSVVPREDEGWIKTGREENAVWRNVGLAHKAFSELVDVLTDPHGEHRWGLIDTFRKTTISVMRDTKIKYNATCSQALSEVYGDLIDLALGEYIAGDSFKQLVESKPYLRSQIGRGRFSDLRRRLFKLNRGKSDIRKPEGYVEESLGDAYERLREMTRRMTPAQIREMQIKSVREALKREKRE